MVHFASATRFNHQTSRGTQALLHQMLVHSTDCQQRGDCHMRGIDSAISNDQQIEAQPQRVLGMRTK